MKEAPDIVETIEQYLSEPMVLKGTQLRPYYALRCPFHGEDKNPSFAVFPNVQRWKCFACSPEGGDVFAFVARIRGITIEQARDLVGHEMTAARHMLKEMSYVPDLYKHESIWAIAREIRLRAKADLAYIPKAVDWLLLQDEFGYTADEIVKRYMQHRDTL